MPGRCGYGWPGRGGAPGCCGRTGCEGSGRGPPIGGRELGYCGRGCPGMPGRGGPPGRAPGTPVAPGAPAGRAATGAAGFGGAIGRCTARGGGVVGSGCVGVVGRSVSMRRRNVGGTMRPGAGRGAAGGAAGAGGAAATGGSTSGTTGGGSTTGAGGSTWATGATCTTGGAGGGVGSVFKPRVATCVGAALRDRLRRRGGRRFLNRFFNDRLRLGGDRLGFDDAPASRSSRGAAAAERGPPA